MSVITSVLVLSVAIISLEEFIEGALDDDWIREMLECDPSTVKVERPPRRDAVLGIHGWPEVEYSTRFQKRNQPYRCLDLKVPEIVASTQLSFTVKNYISTCWVHNKNVEMVLWWCHNMKRIHWCLVCLFFYLASWVFSYALFLVFSLLHHLM